MGFFLENLTGREVRTLDHHYFADCFFFLLLLFLTSNKHTPFAISITVISPPFHRRQIAGDLSTLPDWISVFVRLETGSLVQHCM
ncbi:hypothetical protein QVD17_35661 [Tagetes erecta]|uniref:Uncharacterized protein n=1 Tax=Tagetes erecta TaxID=13708 RepID=A0AAD8JUU9_TARER|nr:hypothetical protein QVD17_35661 [Tagetes erecta]